MGPATPRVPARLLSAVSLPGRVVSGAPLTTVYVLVLLVTSIVLRLASAADADRLMEFSSTDVAHLGRDPLTVLVLSALWLPGGLWFPSAVVLLAVAAPLERRIGTALASLVFLSGHVLATLLTELPIAAAIGVGWLPSGSAHRIDVGASYGLLAVVAASVGRLPRLRGLVILVLAWALVAGFAIAGPDMTMYGHALAVVIGVWWWPVLDARSCRHPGP